MVTYKGHTYTNGNVPKALLAPLDGENYGNAVLRRDAAESYNRARAEVKAKTGIVLAVRGWNRSLAEQVTFYLQRHDRAGKGDRVCCYWNGVPYRFTGTAHAAPPGTSKHGWGLAIDVVDFGNVGNFNHPRRVASIAILKKHGWTDDEGRGSIREPWHLVYDPARDTQKNAKPTTPTQEVPDMDTTQAKQLSETRAIAGKLEALIADLHAGIAPQIPTSATQDPEWINFRAAVRDIRVAVTRELDDAVAAGVAVALEGVTGVDQAAITAGVVAEVRKHVQAVTDSVSDTTYVMTPKEN